ncbi:MAG: hypothetical protein KTR14_09200, partial [Vampirovibrio sp.]|nr:hypothetical protein [Vampirovibrio sp.]
PPPGTKKRTPFGQVRRVGAEEDNSTVKIEQPQIQEGRLQQELFNTPVTQPGSGMLESAPIGPPVPQATQPQPVQTPKLQNSPPPTPEQTSDGQ